MTSHAGRRGPARRRDVVVRRRRSSPRRRRSSAPASPWWHRPRARIRSSVPRARARPPLLAPARPAGPARVGDRARLTSSTSSTAWPRSTRRTSGRSRRRSSTRRSPCSRPGCRPDARLLDAGCGSGRELARSRLVPDGEVVGIDLAAGMVTAAHRAARAHGLDNTAFFQADVGDLPAEFTGAFDLVYSCLAHHHYPDPAAATSEVLRCLRPGGALLRRRPGAGVVHHAQRAAGQAERSGLDRVPHPDPSSAGSSRRRFRAHRLARAAAGLRARRRPEARGN